MSALVDTSALSLAFRRRRTDLRSTAERSVVQRLTRLVDNDEAAIIGMVRQELLSGVRSAEQFQALRKVLDGLVFVTVDVADHDLAAEYFNRCRGRGVAATDVDMLVCAAAAGRDLPVFTTDSDFQRYATILNIRLEPVTT